ncbi:MAG: Dyp-type peroxidase [Acidobacteriota bacterium]|nr:Dyp-type peroxidase [Acidobacteriota bacterium]
MPVDLNAPLELKTADAAVLDDLQGNILKGHGRNNTINLFLQFDAAQSATARAFVKILANKVTSASKQFADTERFKASNKQIPGDTFVALFLSFAGYQALGINAAQIPGDASFQAGLQAQGGILNDPPVNKWDTHFQGAVHAMVLIGDDDKVKREQMQHDIIALMSSAVKLVGKEKGLAMRNTSNDGIEHFGYVDGRSQPLLLVEDIENETDTTDGTHVWNPAFPLKQALVPCPGGTAGTSFGSYFVFRKLEQNVKGFKKREQKVADILQLPEKDRELAGAMIVGRFEDGTPVTQHFEDGADNPVPNNFNYESDTKGAKCPFHGHIRKTNPRGESVGAFAADVEEERSHIMARRGITYGKRVWENGAVNTVLDENHLPSKNVGLLFMAYQNDIGNQFEFTQRFWANNEGFVKSDPITGQPLTGLDPIIGQGVPTIQLQQSREWGKDNKGSFDHRSFVTLKGGEYFYAPCVSFLKSV